MQRSKHASRITAYNQNTICAVTHINYNITKGIEISNDSRYRPVGNSNYPQRAAKQRADHTKRGRKILSRVAKQTGATLIISV